MAKVEINAKLVRAENRERRKIRRSFGDRIREMPTASSIRAAFEIAMKQFAGFDSTGKEGDQFPQYAHMKSERYKKSVVRVVLRVLSCVTSLSESFGLGAAPAGQLGCVFRTSYRREGTRCSMTSHIASWWPSAKYSQFCWRDGVTPQAFSLDLNGQPDRWAAHCLVSTGISGDAEVNATPQDQKTRACFVERSNVSFATMLAKFCEVKSTLFSKRLPVQLCPR
jgi:hypothetical protein